MARTFKEELEHVVDLCEVRALVSYRRAEAKEIFENNLTAPLLNADRDRTSDLPICSTAP